MSNPITRLRSISLRKALAVAAMAAILGVVVIGSVGAYLYSQRLAQHREWFEQGMQAYEEGDYTMAHLRLQLWLVQHPDDVETLEVYARAVSRVVADRLDKLRKAAVAYNQILRTNPADRAAHERLCELYARAEMWGNLLTYTEAQLLDAPEDPLFLFYRSRALHEIGRLDSALEAYLEQIERETPFKEAYRHAARMLMDRGRPADANAIIERGLQTHPDDAEMLVQAAQFFSATRQTDRANAAFEAAFALESDSPSVWVAQARHLNMQRRYAEAAEAAQQAVALDPASGPAYGQLALSLERQGMVDEAIALLQGLDPILLADHSTLLLSLAEMQLSRGDLDDMDATIAQYMTSYPTHRVVQDYFRGRRLLVEGDAAGAANQLALVHEEAPGFGPAQFFLAIAYRDAGNRMLARATLDAYRRNYPDDERARIMAVRDFQTQSRTIGEARVNARAIADDPTADLETLLAAALSLFEAAQREQRLAAEFPLVRELIDTATGKFPTDERAYRLLAEMYVAQRDVDAARGVLDNALARGVAPDAIAIARANLALAGGNADGARQVMVEYMNRPGVTVGQVMRWVAFFRSRGEAELAVDTIETARSSFDGSDRLRLDAEYAAALARAGEALAALEALNAVDADLADLGDDAPEAVVSATLEVARGLLQLRQADATETASILIARAAAARPDDPLVMALQAEERLRQDPPDFAGAYELLLEANEQHPTDIRVLAGLSTISELRGDLAGAFEYARQASDAAPEIVSVQLRAAELALQQERPTEALDRADAVLAAAPNEPNAMGVRAAALLAVGQLAQAEAAVGAIESVHGADPAVQPLLRSLRSNLLTASGEGEEALALLRQDYEERPDNLAAAQAFAEKLAQLGRADEGESVMREFVQREPDNADAWIGLARAQVGTASPDALDQASESLTRALVISPNETVALRQLIDIQIRRGSLNEALALCDRYLDLRPNQADVLFQKARLLAARPESQDRAIEVISTAISVSDQPEFRALRGTIHLEQGAFEEARGDLQAAVNALPNTTAMLDMALAEALVGLQQYNAARPFFLSAQRKHEAGQIVDLERLGRLGRDIEQGVG